MCLTCYLKPSWSFQLYQAKQGLLNVDFLHIDFCVMCYFNLDKCVAVDYLIILLVYLCLKLTRWAYNCYIADNLFFEKLVLHLQIWLHWERHLLERKNWLDLIEGFWLIWKTVKAVLRGFLFYPKDLPIFSGLIISAISSESLFR